MARTKTCTRTRTHTRTHTTRTRTRTLRAHARTRARTRYHNTSAPNYVVVGSAGAMQAETWTEPTPPWSAVRLANGAGHFYTDTYGYGSLRVRIA